MMKAGEIAEISIWLSGEETEENLRKWKEEDVPKIMKHTEETYGVKLGPVKFTELLPGQEKVPPVPPFIKGINVRLLLAEADVFPRTVYEAKAANTFVNDLTKKDLALLRRITRRAHFKAHPGDRLSDKQCDVIIDSLGIEVALRTLNGETIN